jgi:hypothetical protein
LTAELFADREIVTDAEKESPRKAQSFGDESSSYGAVSLLQFASSNFTGFMQNILLKLNRDDEGDTDEDKRERKSIDEIDEILEQYREVTGSREIIESLLGVLYAHSDGDFPADEQEIVATTEKFLKG